MTNEEALRLAKLAWPDANELRVWLGYDDVGAMVSHQPDPSAEYPELLLSHRDPARFEAALRVLAGEPSTADKKLNAICRVLEGEP